MMMHNQDGTATHDSSADQSEYDYVLEFASAFLDHFPADLDDEPRHLALLVAETGFACQKALDALNLSVGVLEQAFYQLLCE